MWACRWLMWKSLGSVEEAACGELASTTEPVEKGLVSMAVEMCLVSEALHSRQKYSTLGQRGCSNTLGQRCDAKPIEKYLVSIVVHSQWQKAWLAQQPVEKDLISIAVEKGLVSVGVEADRQSGFMPRSGQKLTLSDREVKPAGTPNHPPLNSKVCVGVCVRAYM